MPAACESALDHLQERGRAHSGVLQESNPAGWAIDWNVDCQSVGDAQASLEYLSRDVFKVAISEGRLLRADDTEGCFATAR